MSAAPETCGCVRDGGRLAVRCPQAQYLWDELTTARDTLVEASAFRKGQRKANHVFAEYREAYHQHIRDIREVVA
jgi:hypothetical protein